MKRYTYRFSLLAGLLLATQWWRSGQLTLPDVAMALMVVVLLMLVSMAGDYFWKRVSRRK